MSDMEYLCDKPAFLNANGSIVSDVYYNCGNSTMNNVEIQENVGKYIQTLGSLSFGSTSNITIPNQNLLNETYLELEIDAADVPANVTLTRGWGYLILSQIQYMIGASSSSSLTFSGQSLWQTLCAQCETAEKRSEYLRLGGEEYLGASVTPAGQDPVRLTAMVLLPLPWSTAVDKLPLDTSLLTNPIVITIALNSAASICGGSGVFPTKFKVAQVTYREGVWSNPTQSLKSIMIREPELMVNYPFIHTQYFTPPSFPGCLASTGQRCSVNLLGFINADLNGIILGVVRNRDLQGTSSIHPNAFNYDPITNIELTYNGAPLYRLPSDAYKVINMTGSQQSSFFHNSMIRDAAAAPFNSDPVDSYLVFINFSRQQSATFAEHYQNTPRVSNQVLNVQFNTKWDASTQYTLFASYLYPGAVTFQNGASQIRLQ